VEKWKTRVCASVCVKTNNRKPDRKSAEKTISQSNTQPEQQAATIILVLLFIFFIFHSVYASVAMSLMKIHRGNESFSCCWLLLLVALLLAEAAAAAAAAATLSETQTNATNGAIREPPVQLQQQQKLQNATAGDGESQNSAEIFIHSDMGKFSSILPVKKHTRTLKHSQNEKNRGKIAN